jgi:hypothetical protein
LVRFTASEYTQRSLATGKRAFKFFSRIHPIRWLNEHGDDWWYDLKKWLFAVVLIMLGTDPAGAQMMCGTHEEITTKLETQYDEKLVANGISRQGLLVDWSKKVKFRESVTSTRRYPPLGLTEMRGGRQTVFSAKIVRLAPPCLLPVASATPPRVPP